MSREERVGGVEPETVTVAREDYVPPSAFRRVEEELRQAREERDAYRASWEREATDAARYRLHHEACVRQRDKARKAATGWVEDVSSMAARVDDMAGDLRACRAALDWYAKEDRYDVGRASSRPVVLADRGLLARRALAALSPVQGEHEQDGEDAGVVGESALPGEGVRGEGPQRFRKKPVVIEAMRWDGTPKSLRAICQWANTDLGADDPYVSYLTQTVGKNTVISDVQIDTLEGPMTASPGDWIIRGVKGEFYACKPDVFGIVTYHPDSVLVEKVAKALWEARDSLPWALAPQVQYRRDAGAVLSVACPLVAGVIADRLDERAGSAEYDELADQLMTAARFVRFEFDTGGDEG